MYAFRTAPAGSPRCLQRRGGRQRRKRVSQLGEHGGQHRQLLCRQAVIKAVGRRRHEQRQFPRIDGNPLPAGLSPVYAGREAPVRQSR